MKIIAHRGNVFGPNTQTENTPCQIDYCILKGYDVEIDVWYVGRHFYLGHDTFKTLISLSFLEDRKDKLWIHIKNLLAMKEMQGSDFNYFWHQHDAYTLTSKGYVWTFPGLDYCPGAKQVLLDFSNTARQEYYKNRNIYGLCLDYIEV